jgi:hypothetical protein
MVVQLNHPNQDKMPIGMHHIPNTGRKFYWTGKVAIGIAHQPPALQPSYSEQLIQSLMLRQALAA